MPAFDDSVQGTHPEDYALLLHGHVHFYRHRWAADRLRADLGALGYALIDVDISGCGDPDAVRGAVIAAVPGWPSGYGQTTWAGFNDGLTDRLLDAGRQQVVLMITGWDQAHRTPGTEAWTLLDMLAAAGQWHLLFGRRLICLAENDDPFLEIPPVGAQHTGWNRHERLYKHRTGERIPPWVGSPGGGG